jgi:hypothetical protein
MLERQTVKMAINYDEQDHLSTSNRILMKETKANHAI